MIRKFITMMFFTGVICNASAQLKIGDQPTIMEKSVALDVKGSANLQGLWLPRVADTSMAGIRALNPPDGLVIYHIPSGKLFLRTNNSWVTYLDQAVTNVTAGGPAMTGPALTLNTGTTGTDFNISSTGNIATWNLPSASATNRGAVTIAAQTFGGAKTFGNGVTVNNGSTLNNGTIANGGLTVSGATTNTSNLTLGVSSATAPAAATDRYLSVNAAGIVTLNSVSNVSSITAGGTTLTGALTHNTGTAGTDFNISSAGSIVTWNMPSASVTNRGVVTTAAQTFAGAKTFGNGITVNNGSVLNNGTSANGGLIVTGAAGSVSNLTLGITSATIPDTTTNKYLSVNAAGVVTLNSVNVTATIPVRIKSYRLEINEAPITVKDNEHEILTFTVPGGGLSLSSTVLISPTKSLYVGFSINWARVVNGTTIEMAVSSVGDKQKLNPGLGNEATFNIMVYEF